MTSVSTLTSTVVKKFKVQYTDASGVRVTEAPRLVISVDGQEKSLWIGHTKILATVPRDTDDAELWALARARM